MPIRTCTDRRLSVSNFLVALSTCVAFMHAGAATLEEDFAIAVANDRVVQVKELLARGVDANAVDAMGNPMLVIAAKAMR